ncbi:MAG: hypothetical protein AAF636_03175 [Pseudomonadota bacterium]
MKPNFTLHLSADGLRLLHRAASGWQIVGTADVRGDTLVADLDRLRRSAMALEPNGLCTRLSLPNDQIRYTSFDVAGRDPVACRLSAKDALEGLTPYAVKDLVFDTLVRDDVCHIAAVARETLDEAENFAADHGFEPVCFTARSPLPHAPWEPFFGRTRAALIAGKDVSPEPAPVVKPPKKPDSSSVADPATPTDLLARLLFTSRRKQPRVTPTTGTTPPSPAIRSDTALKRPVPGASKPVARRSGGPRAPVISQPSAPTPAYAAPPVKNTSGNHSAGGTRRFDANDLAQFGAQSSITGARRGGLNIRVVAVSIVLGAVGVGAWSVGVTPDAIWSALRSQPVLSPAAPVAQFASPIQPPSPTQTAPGATEQKLFPTPAKLSNEDKAVLDALRTPFLSEPDVEAPPIIDAARTQYAVTGIWIVPPDAPRAPELIAIDDLVVTSIAPFAPSAEVVALSDNATLEQPDVLLPTPSAPAPAGLDIELNDQGLVTATVEGTANPDGIWVFAGKPAVVPPERPQSVQTASQPRFARLDEWRPRARPANLAGEAEQAATVAAAEQAEAVLPVQSELAATRPKARPRNSDATALAAASLFPADGTPAPVTQADETGTAESDSTLAVRQSRRPDARPKDFLQTAAVLQATTAAAQATRNAPAPVRTASVAPSVQSSASARRQATVSNAINLRRINLIGVYGKPTNRRALVRMEDGRYLKVTVGDRIDGGRISAIGDTELRYQKSGRNIVLKMPKG